MALADPLGVVHASCAQVGSGGMCRFQASCGGTHTMVLSSEGRIFVWGRGSFGRLGSGAEKDHYSPVEVFLPGRPPSHTPLTSHAGLGPDCSCDPTWRQAMRLLPRCQLAQLLAPRRGDTRAAVAMGFCRRSSSFLAACSRDDGGSTRT